MNFISKTMRGLVCAIFVCISWTSYYPTKATHLRKLQSLTDVFCPLKFLSFQLPVTNQSNVTTSDIHSSIVNYTFTFEGDDFDVYENTVSEHAIVTINKGVKRKLNKISIACDYYDKDLFLQGELEHYMSCEEVHTVVIGNCTDPKTNRRSCAKAISTLEVFHDKSISFALAKSIILESSKLYMQFNLETPYHLTYLGPFPFTATFKITLIGVPPLNMSTHDITVYENTLIDMLENTTLSENATALNITSARVLNQKVSIFRRSLLTSNSSIALENSSFAEVTVENEVLGYYSGTVDDKDEIIYKIIQSSKKFVFAEMLRHSGSGYFANIIEITSFDGFNVTSFSNTGRNVSFEVPGYYSGISDFDENVHDTRTSSSVASTFAAVIVGLFAGILLAGISFGVYAKKKRLEKL